MQQSNIKGEQDSACLDEKGYNRLKWKWDTEIFWDLMIEMDPLILAWRPDWVLLINKKKWSWH